jgi:molybdate/tungstate transport system substrate-binding protein
MLAADGGLKVLKEMGQPPFIPCRVTTQAVKESQSLPGNLGKLVEVRE